MTDKASILKLSQKFLAKGQVDKAIQVWEEFVSSNPDGNIYNMIGDLYLKKNDKKNANAWFHKAAKFIRDEGFSLKALAIYKKILNFDSTDPQALYALGELNEEKGLAPDAIKFYLASIDALNKRGQKSDVLEIYNKILSLAPSNIPLRSKVADNLAKEGLLQDASKELIYIARLYEEKGDSKAAVDYFNKALIIFPRNKDAYLTMSKLYETLGKKKEALDVLSRAFQSFPEDEDLKLQIAHQLITNNEFDQAIDLLKQVGEREPDNIKVKEEIAKIHLLKGNKEKAWTIYSPIVDELLMMKSPDQLIGILREFSEIEPVEVGRKLASLYRQTGEIDNAFHELVKLANILKDSGMYEEATSVINEAGLLKPDNEEVGLLLSSLQQEMGIDQVTAQDNKTTDDLLSEIEVLLRYGQSAAALKMLETLKSREPSHIEVHRKLKVIYLEMGEKELAVTECIILANLYEKNGDAAGREQILNEAYDINPLDPRLPDRGEAPALDEDTTLAPSGLEPKSSDTFTEEIAEADFYARQGLEEEALKIYQKYAEQMPGNKELRKKIQDILSSRASAKAQQEANAPSMDDLLSEKAAGPSEAASPSSVDDVMFKGTEETPASAEPSSLDDFLTQDTADTPREEGGPSLEDFMKEEPPVKETGGFVDLSIDDGQPVAADEIPEPTLENDVLEIFEEFKKGIESELEEGDSETHYNLGIAYKEMGLIDDAIKEFQTASRDPKRQIQGSSMLGLCYKEKGLYSLAVDAFRNALSQITERGDAYWGTKFDLAEAYQKNGNLREAGDIFTEIYAYNAKFRNVDEKLNSLKGYIGKSAGPDQKKKKDRISYI